MSNTPLFELPHICLIGSPNSGKSTLFNLLLDKEIAITSYISGTTTDPIYQTTEIINFGRVRLIDTAGLDDKSLLSDKRNKKTLEAIEKSNLVLYILDATADNLEDKIEQAKTFLNNIRQKSLIIINKNDLINLKSKSYNDVIMLSEDISKKKKQLLNIITANLEKDTEENLLDGIKLTHNNILLVIRFDSEAPSGRLILPQNKLIHDAIRKDIFTYVVNFNSFKSFLNTNKNKIDLVITDSKIFKEVSALVPDSMQLTSFSILFAKSKGDLKLFYDAIKVLENLKTKKGRILIKESCTHTKNHEDIGTKIIPNLIKKNIGEHIEVIFDSNPSLDFENDFDLVIHCGGCMMSRTQMRERIFKVNNKKIPITNYGLVLAYFAGILDRAIEPFKHVI